MVYLKVHPEWDLREIPFEGKSISITKQSVIEKVTGFRWKVCCPGDEEVSVSLEAVRGQ